MSGGTAVQTESHGVVRAQAKPSHGPWLSPEANAKGLVLTEDGAAGPEREGKKVSPSGLSKNAQGIEAEWPRQLAGSVHESLVRRMRLEKSGILLLTASRGHVLRAFVPIMF